MVLVVGDQPSVDLSRFDRCYPDKYPLMDVYNENEEEMI